MSDYRYTAARPDGARIKGRLAARSPEEAAHLLVDRGLFPVVVAPAGAGASLLRVRPVRTLATAVQSLAALIEVGVPLHHALEATAEVVSGAVHDALLRMRERVREGSTLSAALAAEGALFPPVTIGLVRAGERGVGLARGLEHAARQLERDAETRAALQAALAYPVVLFTVGSVAVALIVLVVLPRFAALLADVQGTLPAATRALLAASAFLHNNALVVTAVLGAAIALLVVAVWKERERLAASLLDAPLIGPIRHGLATAHVARALGALLGAGSSAVPALAIARDAAGDPAVAARLQGAQQRVAEGQALGEALGVTRALTPAAVQLVRIGERSGRLGELLEQASRLEERSAARRVQVLVTALEPAVIVGFALMVAFVAGALLQALYSVRAGAL